MLCLGIWWRKTRFSSLFERSSNISFALGNEYLCQVKVIHISFDHRYSILWGYLELY